MPVVMVCVAAVADIAVEQFPQMYEWRNALNSVPVYSACNAFTGLASPAFTAW